MRGQPLRESDVAGRKNRRVRDTVRVLHPSHRKSSDVIHDGRRRSALDEYSKIGPAERKRTSPSDPGTLREVEREVRDLGVAGRLRRRKSPGRFD